MFTLSYQCVPPRNLVFVKRFSRLCAYQKHSLSKVSMRVIRYLNGTRDVVIGYESENWRNTLHILTCRTNLKWFCSLGIYFGNVLLGMIHIRR